MAVEEAEAGVGASELVALSEPEAEVEAVQMVGDNIRADSNFVDDNWDSDDE